MFETNNIDDNTPLYSISAAAKIVGISVHTIRMYEREGIILPFKEDGHNRLFSNNDIERLRCIRRHIKEKKFTIASIKTMYSFIPCWHIVKCPEEVRDNCDAYNKTGQPCWSYKNLDGFCNDKNCRDCSVYYGYSNCEQIKKEINNRLRQP